jgi:hypothetical protein
MLILAPLSNLERVAGGDFGCRIYSKLCDNLDPGENRIKSAARSPVGQSQKLTLVTLSQFAGRAAGWNGLLS